MKSNVDNIVGAWCKANRKKVFSPFHIVLGLAAIGSLIGNILTGNLLVLNLGLFLIFILYTQIRQYPIFREFLKVSSSKVPDVVLAKIASDEDTDPWTKLQIAEELEATQGISFGYLLSELPKNIKNKVLFNSLHGSPMSE